MARFFIIFFLHHYMGITRSLKEHYKNKYAELRSMLKDVKKQLKIADEIIREENEKSERSIEEVREEKQTKERDKQPQK